MSKEAPAAIDPTLFEAVFKENWENARHIKNERIWFMNAFSLITAGVLTLFQSVRGSAVLQITLLLFMCLFSVILTSLRLKGELEECLAKLEAMSVQANINEFVALGQREGKFSRYPKFRWIFPFFYSMTTVAFVALIAYRLIAGETIR
jgi:hypothetical protein